MSQAQKSTDSAHWRPIAKSLVSDLRKNWGLGWDSLGLAFRRALVAERVLATVCSWPESTSDKAISNALALRLEAMRLIDPE